MLARGHIDINNLHGEPRHEDKERQHGEDTTNGCIIRRVVLVGQTDWLPEPVEFLEELVI